MLDFIRVRIAKFKVGSTKPLRVIFGAGETLYPGWVATDYPVLDMTDAACWERLFNNRKIQAALAEHVLEHFDGEQLHAALTNVYSWLADGGYLRIAVPDGFHPDPAYLDMVKPDGSGAGAWDHKLLFNYKNLTDIAEGHGFHVRLLEWFDENGDFHHEDWRVEDGCIRRSAQLDARNRSRPLSYTSLICDCYKASGTAG